MVMSIRPLTRPPLRSATLSPLGETERIAALTVLRNLAILSPRGEWREAKPSG